jgi:hypothetical protein
MSPMDRWVEITFDCLPLRSIGRLDIPLDASPKYRAFCEQVKRAIETHGTHNTYFLHNARCVFHLVNSADVGMLEYAFHGTVFTDGADVKTERTDLEVGLLRETCDWLTQPIVEWFAETVRRAVATEFDRYIAAGDLEQTRQRIAKIQSASDDADGFVGMYL